MKTALLILGCVAFVQMGLRAEEAKGEAPAPPKEEVKKEEAKPEEVKKEEVKKEEVKKEEAAPADAVKKLEEENKALGEKLAEKEKAIEELRKQVEALTAEIKQLKGEAAAAEAKPAPTISAPEKEKQDKRVKELIVGFRGKSADRFKSQDELKKIGKPAVPALIEASKSEHFYVSQTAIQTLGDIEDCSSVPALLEILAGPNDELAAHANRSLGKITRQYFGTIGVGETAEEKQQIIESWKKWWTENSEKLLGAKKE